MPYSPLGRGFLTGRFRSAADFDATDTRRERFPRFSDEAMRRNLAVVDALEKLAGVRGVTAGQLALAWVQHRGRDVVPIPGTRRRTYLEQNVTAATLTLTPDDLAALESAVPAGAVHGTRYAAPAMRLLDR
ncbi:MAG: aldo/keto reductase [Micromonosporaceae bacterium]